MLALTHLIHNIGLRDRLLAQVRPDQSPATSDVDNMRRSGSHSPQDENIDPAIAGNSLDGNANANANTAGSGESGGDDTQGEGSGKRGGKRELSTSKRAAQNRAAQVSLTLLCPRCMRYICKHSLSIYALRQALI